MSELVRRVRDRIPLPRRPMSEPPHWLADRPGALFAAGSVGAQGGEGRRRSSTRPEPARPARPGPPGFVDSADAPTAEELPRRQRSPVTVRELQATPRGRIMLALRSPGAVRQAMVLSEVLAPPVALRESSAGQE